MQRRTFLRAGAAAAIPAVVGTGVVSAAPQSGQTPGIVWSWREYLPETQALFDVVAGPGGRFTFVGYDPEAAGDRTYVRLTDRFGRERAHRRGSDENEWGDRGYELLAVADGFLMAGVEDGAPLLVKSTKAVTPPQWGTTYDGSPDGAVYAAATGDSYAVGWTESGDSSGATVVGTDDSGTRQWSDSTPDGRRLQELFSTTNSRVVAVGSDGESGWATVWQSDGTRERDVTLDTPGTGPVAAVADGTRVVLAGTSSEGWWLQRRAADWSVEWTRTYAADGSDRGVDDVVVRSDGYGVLAHDDAGTVVLRTAGDGAEQWRGHYAPYTDEESGPADRGHAMVPVDGDQFVLAGVTAPGEEDRDVWTARVGEPGETTPSTPEATPTPGPTTTPAPTTPAESPAGTPDPDDGTPTDSTPSSTGKSTTAGSGDQSSGGPGFGILAAVAGLTGWAALRRREN